LKYFSFALADNRTLLGSSSEHDIAALQVITSSGELSMFSDVS
jgi:hypothetical protein